MIRFIIILLVLQIAEVVQAQPDVEAMFSVDHSSPLIGEPVVLILAVTTSANVVITAWPEIDREWVMFSVRDAKEPVIAENSDGTITYTQSYELQLWYPGEYSTPDLFVGYRVTGSEETRFIPVRPAFFSVPSTLDETDTNLRPMKPLIWQFYISPVLGIGLIGLIAAAIVTAFHIRHRFTLPFRGTLEPQSTLPPPTPGQRALAELKRIYQRNLSPAQTYISVADCLRTYTEARFDVPAPDLTTEELIQTLEHMYSSLPSDLSAELEAMLRQADLTKFARFEPSDRSAKSYLNTAGKWIQKADAITDVKSPPEV